MGHDGGEHVSHGVPGRERPGTGVPKGHERTRIKRGSAGGSEAGLHARSGSSGATGWMLIAARERICPLTSEDVSRSGRDTAAAEPTAALSPMSRKKINDVVRLSLTEGARHPRRDAPRRGGPGARLPQPCTVDYATRVWTRTSLTRQMRRSTLSVPP